MQYFLLTLHALISVLLIIVVLLQQSKGGGLAGSFGGAGAGEAFFGARGVMTILHKATVILGAAFMISSLVLVVSSSTSGRRGHSLSQQAGQQAPVQAPTAIPLGEGEGLIPDANGLAEPIPTENAPTGDSTPADEGKQDGGASTAGENSDAAGDDGDDNTP